MSINIITFILSLLLLTGMISRLEFSRVWTSLWRAGGPDSAYCEVKLTPTPHHPPHHHHRHHHHRRTNRERCSAVVGNMSVHERVIDP